MSKDPTEVKEDSLPICPSCQRLHSTEVYCARRVADFICYGSRDRFTGADDVMVQWFKDQGLTLGKVLEEWLVELARL